jgi:hypothetical protein
VGEDEGFEVFRRCEVLGHALFADCLDFIVRQKFHRCQ